MNSVATIIPVHRKHSYVIKSIISALRQDYENNYVYVVVNTQDESIYSWINKELGSDICLLNSPNIGSSAARNYGIINSKSDYLAFLDSDDIWYENKLNKQIDYMKKSSTEICGTTMFYRTEKNLSKLVIGKPNFKHNAVRDAKYAPFPLSTFVISRDILLNEGMFSEGLGSISYGQIEDVELYSRLIVNNKISIIDEPLGEYLINNKSATDLYFIKQRDSTIELSLERRNNNFSKLESLNEHKTNKIKSYSEYVEYKALYSFIDKRYTYLIFYSFLMLFLKPVASIMKIYYIFKRSYIKK